MSEWTTVGVVAALWRFPVKSFQGEQLERATWTGSGMAGDRIYAVRDMADGRVLSAKRHGALFEAAARTADDGSVLLILPDGTEVAAEDPGVDEALSGWLGRPVTLARAADGGPTTFEMSFDAEQPERDTFEWSCPAGTFVDLAAAHLLTTASLRAAQRLHPEGDWDVRRFRPGALVEVAGEGFVEDGWVDHDVALGGVVVRGSMATIRCPMPTRPQPGGLPRDTQVAAALRDHHGSNLGLYADVVAAGSVAVGDAVGVRPAPDPAGEVSAGEVPDQEASLDPLVSRREG